MGETSRIQRVLSKHAKEIYLYVYEDYKRENKAKKSFRIIRGLYEEPEYREVIEAFTGIDFNNDIHDIEPEAFEDLYRKTRTLDA